MNIHVYTWYIHKRIYHVYTCIFLVYHDVDIPCIYMVYTCYIPCISRAISNHIFRQARVAGPRHCGTGIRVTKRGLLIEMPGPARRREHAKATGLPLPTSVRVGWLILQVLGFRPGPCQVMSWLQPPIHPWCTGAGVVLVVLRQSGPTGRNHDRHRRRRRHSRRCQRRRRLGISWTFSMRIMDCMRLDDESVLTFSSDRYQSCS